MLKCGHTLGAAYVSCSANQSSGKFVQGVGANDVVLGATDLTALGVSGVRPADVVLIARGESRPYSNAGRWGP